MKGQVIGIDLGKCCDINSSYLRQVLTSISSGTTNSAVAVMEGKAPRIIENAEGMCKIFPAGYRWPELQLWSRKLAISHV